MITWEILSKPITFLESNEVFVFGSNSTGFHGAGAAGVAMRGDSRNNWRQDPEFRLAMSAPLGHENRRGQWAVFGQARGPQVGRKGKAYAVETISEPGKKRSVSLRDIYYQLVSLVGFVRQRESLIFIVTPLGEGLAGYSKEEMSQVWQTLEERHGIPENMRFVRFEKEIKDVM